MEINNYICNNCGFRLFANELMPFYYTDDSGQRNRLPHPSAERRARGILKDISDEEFKNRTGILRSYVCIDCAELFSIDDEKDEHKCSNCASSNYKFVFKMDGKMCPKCRTGTIIKTSSGIFS